MAFFHKAVEQGIKPEDLRMVDVDGDHVIIEAKVNENWYQIDLGGGDVKTTIGKGELKPVIDQASNKIKTHKPKLTNNKLEVVQPKGIEECNENEDIDYAFGDSHIETISSGLVLKKPDTYSKIYLSQDQNQSQKIATKLKEEKQKLHIIDIKEDQQQQQQSKFNEKLTNALKANKGGNILIADASGIDDGKVGSAFNVAIAMLSKDSTLADSLFIVNSPDDLDLTSDQLVIAEKYRGSNLLDEKPKIYRGGRLLEFVNSNNNSKTIIVNWQNFSEQQKVAYNSLLDKVQMIDGKEISPAIRVISVENSGNSDLSFSSRHQEKILFYSGDSNDFIAKNYPKISKNNVAENPFIVDIAGLDNYEQVLFGRVKINPEQQLEYEESPFVRMLSGLNNAGIATKVIIKNLKDDKKTRTRTANCFSEVLRLF